MLGFWVLVIGLRAPGRVAAVPVGRPGGARVLGDGVLVVPLPKTLEEWEQRNIAEEQ